MSPEKQKAERVGLDDLTAAHGGATEAALQAVKDLPRERPALALPLVYDKTRDKVRATPDRHVLLVPRVEDGAAILANMPQTPVAFVGSRRPTMETLARLREAIPELGLIVLCPTAESNGWWPSGARLGLEAGLDVEIIHPPERGGVAEAIASLGGERFEREKVAQARRITPAQVAQAEAPELWPLALRGLAGDVVAAMRGSTEACDPAVLIHFLVAVGAAIGRGPHTQVGHDLHPAALFAACVGDSSVGRKGSALNPALVSIHGADPSFERRILSGLSTGEGLIHQVRDPRFVEQKNSDGDDEQVEVDHGEEDKRLLVIETEFVSVLKRMAREGNTLSPVLRDAWDARGSLSTLTRGAPLHATNPHIVLLVHATRYELAHDLRETEQANGFANRFLWVLTYRARVLPRPVAVSGEQLKPLVDGLRDVLAWAKERQDLSIWWDEQAERAWCGGAYENLTSPVLTDARLVQAILARGAPQVLRLGLLYAILDQSERMTLEHLQAALAVWEYCTESVRRIFGGRTGDSVADAILEAIQSRGEMSRTDLRDLFGRHFKAARIDQALNFLAASGLIVPDRRPSGGRPAEVWVEAGRCD